MLQEHAAARAHTHAALQQICCSAHSTKTGELEPITLRGRSAATKGKTLTIDFAKKVTENAVQLEQNTTFLQQQCMQGGLP